MFSLGSIPANALEIRGAVATGDYQWTPQNFAGFDYDIDSDVGSDTWTTTLWNEIRLSGDYPYGIVYETRTRTKMFNDPQVGTKYGKLSVDSIDSTTGTIIMDNEDNTITLSKNRDIEIIPGISVRVADNDTLRYYIYKNITQPGTYEIRGAVAGSSYTWDPQNFPGFFYDIDNDLGTETLTATLTDDNKLEEPNGVTYRTTSQSKDFKYENWGSYQLIPFLGEEYFVEYIENSNLIENVLYSESIDTNPFCDEQLEKILVDDDTRITVKKGESIKLKEGYELILKGINLEGKIYVQLLKNGKIIDETLLAPSREGSTIHDQTYCYRTNVGSAEKLVTIAVHFKSTYKDEESALAVVDGIWQISENPVDIMVDTCYGKMRIDMIDGRGIIDMDNKDNEITLTKNSDIELMPGIHIRTANSETLRYYIYKTETIDANSGYS
jgi:S-layer protein (TIGR01567 family)